MNTAKKKFTGIAFAALILIGCQKENSMLDVQPKHFLSDDKYTDLTIEIVSVEGYEPNQDALQNLKTFLEETIHKPKGITFKQSTIESPQNLSYTAGDLRSLEEETRTSYAQRNHLTAYIFYADRGYVEDTENSKILGVAYSSTSMCIFKDAINDYSGGIGQVSEEKLETTVLIHEFCHVLGLVNFGTPMTQNHEDPTRPHHCDNENCLMYFESSTTDLLGILGSGEIPTLDSQCQADLRANGGK